MFRPRVIPVLLLRGQGLVKSIRFKDYKYIGDSINAVKIFNDLRADELVFLDIMASIEERAVSLDFVRNVGEEANMPFAVGGGIRDLNTIEQILKAGAERVVINSYALQNPDFIQSAADEFGSSTIAVSIDVKANWLGKTRLYGFSGSKSFNYDPIQFAQKMADQGVGELIINSINFDGTMQGYDLDLIRSISTAVTIPVVAVGGAGKLDDFKSAVEIAYASAVAAGSLFVFHGPRKAVLVNYPNHDQLLKLFSS